MNTSVIEAIERQKTTNLYDASKSIPDDEIRELVAPGDILPDRVPPAELALYSGAVAGSQSKAAGGCG